MTFCVTLAVIFFSHLFSSLLLLCLQRYLNSNMNFSVRHSCTPSPSLNACIPLYSQHLTRESVLVTSPIKIHSHSHSLSHILVRSWHVPW